MGRGSDEAGVRGEDENLNYTRTVFDFDLVRIEVTTVPIGSGERFLHTHFTKLTDGKRHAPQPHGVCFPLPSEADYCDRQR